MSGAISAPNSGRLKGVQIKIRRCCKKHLFCRSAAAQTTYFVEPSSCVPLFLSSRVRAYPYFCRSEFVRTPIFVEPGLCISVFLQSFFVDFDEIFENSRFPKDLIEKSSPDFSVRFSVILLL